MIAQTPPMGWNSWNTFGENISEKLIIETTDALIENGYRDAGYEYIIIDDCWLLMERVDGKLIPDPKLFPHGMNYLSDYIHSKGLKFGMYSCAGVKTCGGYPSSYGYEFEDAAQFAEWGVDYLKYDFCNFPESANVENAYLTMAMALRNCGRDILFAACNWGVKNPSQWMRSRGAHTYRSTGDIFDNATSFTDIFKSQCTNVENNSAGFYNDMDMLIVGMHGVGNVGLEGCSDDEYLLHFAMWAFLGSPLIIGADIRNLSDSAKAILQNKSLIAINQDSACCPPFLLKTNSKYYAMMRILSGGRFAVAIFNINEDNKFTENISIAFDDLGIRANTPRRVKLTDAVTGEDLGIFDGSLRFLVEPMRCRICIGEILK